MVEPLFFGEFSESIRPKELISLNGAEARHAIAVRRIQLGEAIAIANGKGIKARGVVEELHKEKVWVRVIEVERSQLPTLRLTLVQALAKGDRDELAIQAATELGASTVIPWQAERSVALWRAEKADKGQKRWLSIVTEAAKQSLRSWVPNVLPVQSSDGLMEVLSDYQLVLVLEPNASVSITDENLNFPITGEVALVVGPEGGISPAELEKFAKAGFIPVHLGRGVLRTSTAGLAAIAYLQARAGNWS